MWILRDLFRSISITILGVASKLDYLTDPYRQSVLENVPWRRKSLDCRISITALRGHAWYDTGPTLAHCFSSVQMLHIQLDPMETGEKLGLELIMVVTRNHQNTLWADSISHPDFSPFIFHCLPAWGLNILLAFYFADAIIGLPCVWRRTCFWQAVLLSTENSLCPLQWCWGKPSSFFHHLPDLRWHIRLIWFP